jgi:uncharacterized protein (DUF3820 family)
LTDDSDVPHGDEARYQPDLGFDGEDLLKLATWEMPFGRFRSRTLIDLPEEYLFWFTNNGFPDGKLGFLMKLALELKANGADGAVREMAAAIRRGRKNA